MVSLSSITENGKAVFLAYDQGMEHGPSDLDEENADPNYILDIAVKGNYNAIIFQKGIAEKYYTGTDYKNKIPLILKLNGKTNLLSGSDPYAPILCTVPEAINLDASAVGYTVYVGSEHEAKMTEEFAGVVREGHEKGLPVLGWMYVKGKAVEGKDIGETTAYAARLGLELGADIIKIKYPGTLESLKKAVLEAGKTKVVVSGGVLEKEEEFLELARNVSQSGAIGMAVGRNIWQRENPLSVSEKLRQIIF